MLCDDYVSHDADKCNRGGIQWCMLREPEYRISHRIVWTIYYVYIFQLLIVAFIFPFSRVLTPITLQRILECVSETWRRTCSVHRCSKHFSLQYCLLFRFCMDTVKKKVLIIGAGASGLGAGRWLLDNDVSDRLDVHVIEARDRLGGRVHTSTEDAGAENIGALGE